MAKRVWRVISWKTSVWRKRVWRTRSWRKRAWRSRGRREWRLRWHSEGVVSKRNRWNGPDFGHCRGHWTRRRTATSQQREGEPTWHVPQEDQQDSAKTWTWTWRVPAGRSQKGNNGSRMPDIMLQSSGNGISRSRSVSNQSQSRATESCDEEPWARWERCLFPVCLARLSRTNGSAIVQDLKGQRSRYIQPRGK